MCAFSNWPGHEFSDIDTDFNLKQIILSKRYYFSDICHRDEQLKPFKLSISRESFLYQGWRLYSRIPETLTAIDSVQEFKKKVRIWVKENIPLLM